MGALLARGQRVDQHGEHAVARTRGLTDSIQELHDGFCQLLTNLGAGRGRSCGLPWFDAVTWT